MAARKDRSAQLEVVSSVSGRERERTSSWGDGVSVNNCVNICTVIHPIVVITRSTHALPKTLVIMNRGTPGPREGLMKMNVLDTGEVSHLRLHLPQRGPGQRSWCRFRALYVSS